MVQLPAGTVEAHEEPEAAVVRELLEETGVEAEVLALAGVLDEVREGEARRRWIYLLAAPTGLPDEWPFHCDCGVATRCYWLPFERGAVMKEQQPWLELAREAASLLQD